ncbi:MAG: hypothetical protein ACREV6_01555 [Clostridium sp.]|uniref:hypothetical protein n=1 Tax=Clostridium sp. TaxID=1506 RepID=UPI003D6C9FD4
MTFDTILFDLDDTIHDRNKSLYKFVDLFILKYFHALTYNSKLIMEDIFLKLIAKDIDQEKKCSKNYETEFHGNVSLI